MATKHASPAVSLTASPAVTLLDDGSAAAQAVGDLLSKAGVTWERHALNTAEALDHLALAPLLDLLRTLTADLHDLRDVALPLTSQARAIVEAHAAAQPHAPYPLFSGVAPLFAELHRALASGGALIAPFINETVSAPAGPSATAAAEPRSEG